MPIMSLGCKHTSKSGHSYTMTSQMLYIMSSASFASEVTDYWDSLSFERVFEGFYNREHKHMIEQVL